MFLRYFLISLHLAAQFISVQYVLRVHKHHCKDSVGLTWPQYTTKVQIVKKRVIIAVWAGTAVTSLEKAQLFNLTVHLTPDAGSPHAVKNKEPCYI